MSQFVPLYDLESLTEEQRQEYVRNVCNHMGVPPELNLVMLTYLDEEGEGPRRLVAYAKRGATEIIRNNRGINVTELSSKEIGGSIVFTATGKDANGRQEMSTGSKWIRDLAGKKLDDAIMASQTRATRRMTLQFVGAGVLDESEVNLREPVQLKETAFTSVATAPQPSVQPSTEPGKDVTVLKGVVVPLDPQLPVQPAETQEEFEARQKKLREDAIAQLNAKATAIADHVAISTQGTFLPSEPEARKEAVAAAETRTKRKYTRKPRVDMGPSVPPLATPSPVVVPVNITQTIATPATAPVPAVVIVSPPSITIPPLTPPVSVKIRLSPEVVKPFRQRQFKFVNALEENGFAPKEGMGNQDKMRMFASLLFPDVTNFNELTVEQWEKYLATIESKLSTVGPKDTIKYIEDAIGI